MLRARCSGLGLEPGCTASSQARQLLPPQLVQPATRSWFRVRLEDKVKLPKNRHLSSCKRSGISWQRHLSVKMPKKSILFKMPKKSILFKMPKKRYLSDKMSSKKYLSAKMPTKRHLLAEASLGHDAK